MIEKVKRRYLIFILLLPTITFGSENVADLSYIPPKDGFEKDPRLFNYSKKRDLGYHTPRYSTTDKGLIALYEALNAMDWNQTSQIARNPDKYSENYASGGGFADITGHHPSRDQVHAIMGAQALAPPIIYNVDMPDPLKKMIMLALIGIKANNVKGNQSVGLDAYRW